MKTGNWNVLIDGQVYVVTEVFTVADETNPDPDTRLTWLREYAPEGHLMDRLKDEGITHVLGGGEDFSVAIPVEQAGLEMLRTHDLMVLKVQGSIH